MGRWGPTTFEDDGALDYLHAFLDRLVAVNEEVLANRDRFALDEDGSAIFMPNVELLCVLCENLPVAAPPELAVIRRWRECYLAMFDDEIPWLQPREGFAPRYRAEIEGTFARLERLAERWQAQPGRA